MSDDSFYIWEDDGVLSVDCSSVGISINITITKKGVEVDAFPQFFVGDCLGSLTVGIPLDTVNTHS